MRAIWSGSISFGLVNIPIKLFSAVEERGGIDLHMLHKADQAPIRYARICTKDGEEVPYDDVVRGYEYDKDHFVLVTDEDFKAADPKKSSTVDIVEFVAEGDIDVRYLDRPYYLEPEKGAEKAYSLLRESLAKSGKLAVAKFVLREREHLAAIKPVGKVLVLNQMRFPADLRSPGGLKLPVAEVDKHELELAVALIDQMTTSFIPEDFHDTFTEELEDRIEAKVSHKPVPKSKPSEQKPVKDLMASLKASLDAAKK